MSDAAAAVEEKRAEDVQPLELPTGNAVPTEAAESSQATDGPKAAEDTKPLALPEHVINGDHLTEDKAQPTAEPTTTEPTAETVNQTAAEPAAEQQNTAAEPVTSGVLGYKAPGLLKQFKFSKRYFWLTEEPVDHKNLGNYLRGTESKTAHHIAAWSSHTGKGLLYLVKNESEKSHPADIIPLADATDLESHFPHEFSFRVDHEKHTFRATNDAERDGWVASIEKAIADTKGAKDDIVQSDKYQETHKHLGAGAVGGVAAGAVGAKAAEHKEEPQADKVEPTANAPVRAGSGTDDDIDATKKENKKSHSATRGKRSSIFGAFKSKKEDLDAKREAKKEQKEEKKEEKVEEKAEKKEEKAEAKEEKKEEKEEKKEEKAEAKEAKKEEKAEAKEEKKEEKAEAKAEKKAEKEETKAEKAQDKADTHGDKAVEAAAVGAAGTGVAAETAHHAEEPKAAEPVNGTKPKPTKRSSIFGNVFQKVRSPTTEKKESEVAPIVPAKDDAAPRLSEPNAETFSDAPEAPIDSAEPKAEAPIAENNAAAPLTATPVVPTTEDKKEAPVAAKAETPKKEKESFLGSLLSKARAKSPANGKREEKKEVAAAEPPAVPPKDEPKTEPVATEAKPEEAAAPVAAAVESEPKPEEAVSPKTNGTTPKDNRSKSYFGSFGPKNDATKGEKPANKLSSIFRRPSQAMRGMSDRAGKKENGVPEKTEEPVAKSAEATPTEPTANATEPSTTEPAATEPTTAPESEKQQQSIGDVTAASVNVGQPQSNPTVSATA